jgi:hypothetical protein
MSLDTDRDRIRLLLGDTDPSDPLLYDDEIQSFVDYRQVTLEDDTTVTNIPAAAADAAAAIAARFAREFNFGEDGQRFDRAQKFAHFYELEQTLRRRAGGVATT